MKHQAPTLPPEFEPIASELKARWVECLREDTDGAVAPDLLSVEEQVVEFLRRVGLSLFQSFVAVRQEQAVADRPYCGCGRPMSVHRVTEWTRETLLGPVRVRDPYLYCRHCRVSSRPLHGSFGTARETWSLPVQEAAVDLAADESCGKAVAKLGRHHPGVKVERTTALRMVHEHGQRARDFIEEKLGEALGHVERPRGCQPEGFQAAEELEVEFDGGMIPVATLEPIEVPDGEEPELTPVRGLAKRRKVCRWEEVKAGLVQAPGETERLYTLRPTQQLDAAFNDLLGLAVLKGWTEDTQVRGIADGAIHIRVRMAEVFTASPFRFILDRPHAKEHLSSAGQALAPLTGMPAQQWAQGALAQLETGHASRVVDELHQYWQQSGDNDKSRNDTLRKEASYFDRNRDAVAYAHYRDNGWSTASSEIESGHRHLVQCRLKIPGAWWHPDHVDDILALRMLKANGWWQEYWLTQRRQWKAHAHEPPRNSSAATN